MPNTSATGGYLTPTSSPAYDLPLDVQVQGMVSGITGIAGTLVRPRWQPRPPAQPARDVNWCAVGITEVGSAYGHHQSHFSTGDGYDQTEAYEDLELLASFYGPGGSGMASLLRDGLWVAQNREAMQAVGLRLRDVGRRVVLIGELVNQEYVRRADVTVSLARVVTRQYPILNLLEAQISLRESGGHVQNIVVSEN